MALNIANFKNIAADKATLWLLAALIFIWPIPQTNAARYILAFVLLATTIVLHRERLDIRGLFNDRFIRFFSLVLALTTAWFYFVSLVLSDYTTHSLEELNSQWLLSAGFFFFGAILARAATDRVGILLAILFAVVLHIFYIVFDASSLYFHTGELQDKLKGLTGGRDRANVLTNIAAVILLVEVFFRIFYHKYILPLSGRILALLIALSLFSLFLEGARLGVVGVFFMVLTLSMLAIYQRNFVKNKTAVFGVIATAIVVSVSLFGANAMYDKRWANIFETIELAVDIEKNRAWIEDDRYPLPTLKDGSVANDSNYKRPAWIAAGLSFIVEAPLGNGFARDAFGIYRAKKYKEGSPARAAHSSLVDFGVSGGIPALIGWALFLVGLSFVGLRGVLKRQNYYSLLLFFLAGGFFFRMCIDGIARDHMLEQFMFLAGLLLSFSIASDKESKTD